MSKRPNYTHEAKSWSDLMASYNGIRIVRLKSLVGEADLLMAVIFITEFVPGESVEVVGVSTADSSQVKFEGCCGNLVGEPLKLEQILEPN
jgi:hypothetical protein